MALIGEGNGPEYVIPTESKYRTRALALWQSAGKELGVPMMAEGGGKDFTKESLDTASTLWLPLIALCSTLSKKFPSLGSQGMPEKIAVGAGVISTAAKRVFFSENGTSGIGGTNHGIMASSNYATRPLFVSYSPQINITGTAVDIKTTVKEVLNEDFPEFVAKLKEHLFNEGRRDFGLGASFSYGGI